MTPKNISSTVIPLWQTMLFSLLILVVYIVTQAFMLQYYSDLQVDQYPDLARHELLAMMSTDATAISIITIVSSACTTAFIFLILHFRGVAIKPYLGLYSYTKSDFFNWQAIMLAFIVVTSLIAYLLSHDTSRFMKELWASCDHIILLLIAVVIAAPIFEECLFRGFMFTGLHQSHLGTGAAIVMSAATWAMIHTQYGAFDVIIIFLFGIVLAAARIASQSLLLPITLHGTFNFFAVLEMAIFH